jgi:hypothetical protein
VSNTDAILEFLEARRPEDFCDDCLSIETGVEPRQQVNIICNKLVKHHTISRAKGKCARCGDNKAVNGMPKAVPRTSSLIPSQRAKATPEVNSIDVEGMRTAIVRICQELIKKNGMEPPPSRGVAALINMLKDENLIPRHQANMMMTICNLRNVYVWDGVLFGEREKAVATAAWGIIEEWRNPSSKGA